MELLQIIVIGGLDAWCNMTNTLAIRMPHKYPNRPIGKQIDMFHMDVGNQADMQIEAHPCTQTLQPMLDLLPLLVCQLNDAFLLVFFGCHRCHPILFCILHIRSCTLDCSDGMLCGNHANISSLYTFELEIYILDILGKGNPFYDSGF